MKSERKDDKCMNGKKKEKRKDGGINKWKKRNRRMNKPWHLFLKWYYIHLRLIYIIILRLIYIIIPNDLMLVNKEKYVGVERKKMKDNSIEKTEKEKEREKRGRN